MTFKVINHEDDNTEEFESRSNAEDAIQTAIDLGCNPENVELVAPESDGGTEVVNASESSSEPAEAEVVNAPEKLSQDPIGWLNSQNSSFVNTIKGKPAISKQGFRFIQAQFGITTESEVVETFEDPRGVIVWAKAELPDGQSAEAHGEGYITESDVSDNEFVRYADTRSKNRAISDLTSAGALAVSELSGGSE